ncbi:heterokaryon incompatibility protein-domain-containing protein [Paraphoma chrysanthemicola]|nr:heterokaryon incompatibility protein-domain-containing protein [Paraphoma chrysanthemicola]
MIQITDSESTVKLHTSSPAEQDLYVALSYCWDDTQPVQTTKDTIETYKRAIEICTLPQTIKDAISATKALGYKSLWVDALCIVQDDDEDKSREISQMHKIYENAILTISAASARKAIEGFLRKFSPATFPVSMFCWRSHDWFTTFKLDYRCPDGNTCQLSLTSTFEASPINEPINERAWTLQEALLSPRMLMYGRLGMFWRCRSSFETTHDQITWRLWQSNGLLFSLSEPLPVDGIAEEPSHSRVVYMYTFGNNLYNKWMKLVSLYSSRQLSNRHDKLPAIGGIAMKIHAETGVKYIAGLWEDSMLAGLSWQRALSAHPVRRSHTPTFGDHSSWRAPTWSWASIDGPVEYTTYDIHWQSMDPRAHVHRAVAEPRSNSTAFQHLWHAEMHIEGWLKEVEIESIPAAM